MRNPLCSSTRVIKPLAPLPSMVQWFQKIAKMRRDLRELREMRESRMGFICFAYSTRSQVSSVNGPLGAHKRLGMQQRKQALS
jgi:hypothetical protein